MTYKHRHIYNSIELHIDKKEYTIITGARQVGKTTLLREFYKELKRKDKVVHFLSFENVEVLKAVNEHPENLFKFINRPVNPLETEDKVTDRIFLLIDEVQYVNDPSGFLKYLFDTYLDNLKIIATGSSAFYIDSKFRDSLAGRKKIFQLFSLNFLEYLEFLERKDLSDEIHEIKNRKEYISLKLREIYEYFDLFLVYGGYPAVVLEDNVIFKKERLIELRDAYVKRDILESGVRNELDFYQLMTLLAGQIGNLVNKNELSNTLGIHNVTLIHYLQILEKCFYIQLIHPFHKNIRKELTRMPKIFFYDTGLRNALLNRFYPLDNRDDKGALIENYVFSKLKETFHNEEIKYWRTADGNEIDFIISQDYKTGEAYEVKFSHREIKQSGYNKFRERYAHINLNLITYKSSANSGSVFEL